MEEKKGFFIFKGHRSGVIAVIIFWVFILLCFAIGMVSMKALGIFLLSLFGLVAMAGMSFAIYMLFSPF